MTVLLAVIYLAFISLGLPDSLLGAAWPAIHESLGVPISRAGYVSMIAAGGTVLSSLLSARLIGRFGTGRVMLCSVLLTAVTLTAYSFAPSLLAIMLLTIPLGLGGGSVDAALNNYVALHYKASHMSWLHCMWGVGATIGPLIMSACVKGDSGWAAGYRTVAYIQCGLVGILAFSMPLWKRVESDGAPGEGETDRAFVGNWQALRIRGVPLGLCAFLCMVGYESVAGVWGASYLLEIKGMDASTAAFWGSMNFAGITIGRFACGFIASRVDARLMIRAGLCVSLLAGLLLALPLPGAFAPIGLALLGVGDAPLYPSMIHLTPARFGRAASRAVTGLLMAFAYIGSTFMPPLTGLLSGMFTLRVMPPLILALAALALILSETLTWTLREKRA